MTFLQPANLFWAGLVALVVLLYLRVFAVREVEAPALFLWREALARRPAWQRWQRFLSAALQVAILLALVLAAAEPAWVGPERPRRTVAIIVDRSASMRATDIEPTRFDASLAAAKKHVAALAPGDRAMVLSDGAYTDILCPLTDDPAAWSAALDAIKPTDGVGRLTETVAVAQGRLAGESNPEILIFTDGSSPDAPAVAKEPNVQLATFSTKDAANVGIVLDAVRLSPAGEEQSFLQIANFGPREAIVGLGSNAGREPMRKPALPVGGHWEQVRSGMSADATLSEPDALAADNQVKLAAGYQNRPTLFLLGEVSPAIAAAAKTTPGVTVVPTAQRPEIHPAGQAIYICQGAAPPDLAGDMIVFAPTADTDGWKIARAVERPLSVSTRKTSPVIGDVRLDEIVFEGASQVELVGPWEILAAADENLPILATRHTERGRTVLWNFDLARSDLPQRREFATLVRQSIDWLLYRDQGVHSAVSTDDYLHRLVADRRVTVYVNNKPQRELPAGVEWVGPLDQVGRWATGPDRGTKIDATVAATDANLLSPAESNLAPRVTGTIAEIGPAAAIGQPWPLWWIPAGVAALLLVIEWSLYQRRVTI